MTTRTHNIQFDLDTTDGVSIVAYMVQWQHHEPAFFLHYEAAVECAEHEYPNDLGQVEWIHVFI